MQVVLESRLPTSYTFLESFKVGKRIFDYVETILLLISSNLLLASTEFQVTNIDVLDLF